MLKRESNMQNLIVNERQLRKIASRIGHLPEFPAFAKQYGTPCSAYIHTAAAVYVIQTSANGYSLRLSGRFKAALRGHLKFQALKDRKDPNLKALV